MVQAKHLQQSDGQKKKKEEVDIRNTADQLVYQTEKTMADLGDKLTEDDKAAVTPLLDALKEALKGTDTEAIKAASEALSQKFYEISSKLYQNANPGAGPDMGGAQPGADGAYDADYNVVDEDK